MKNDSFLWNNSVKKVTWSVSKLHALNGFKKKKTYNIGHPIFFMNKLKFFFQILVACLVSLDELQWFASQFFVQIFVIWQIFWWFINKIRWKSVFVPTTFSSVVFRKLLDRDGFPTYARRTFWKALQLLHISGNLYHQKSVIDKMNRTNKNLKESWFASNRIVFLLKTKNVSNQAIFRSKIDLRSVYRKYNREKSTLVLEQD